MSSPWPFGLMTALATPLADDTVDIATFRAKAAAVFESDRYERIARRHGIQASSPPAATPPPAGRHQDVAHLAAGMVGAVLQTAAKDERRRDCRRRDQCPPQSSVHNVSLVAGWALIGASGAPYYETVWGEYKSAP